MNERMDPKKLHIAMCYFPQQFWDEEHLKQAVDCGIDMFIYLIGAPRSFLDLMQKYGIGAIEHGAVPGHRGSGWEGQFSETNPLSIYERAASEFQDHPAIWAINECDEPSALDLPHHGVVIDAINRAFPHQFPFINLFPSYASVAENTEDQAKSQLGTRSYEEYLRRYTECIGLDYICFDDYMYAHEDNPRAGQFFDNLRLVAEACRRTGRRMWCILQCGEICDLPADITVNKLRYQVNGAMAFGAEMIGWWEGSQIIGADGEPGEQFARLKTVHRETLAVADDYMRYRNVNTVLVGFPDGDPIPEGSHLESLPELNTGVFFHVHSENGKALCIGQMTARDGSGRQALWIMNAGDYTGTDKEPARVTMNVRDRMVRVRGAADMLTDGGTVSFSLPVCCAALVEADG